MTEIQKCARGWTSAETILYTTDDGRIIISEHWKRNSYEFIKD